MTRYADDIVFSGAGAAPEHLRDVVYAAFGDSVWALKPEKDLLQPIKGRIKIHGLLVKPDRIRLTKQYRNRLRAYKHVIRTKRLSAKDEGRLRGHLNYARQVHENLAPPPPSVASESLVVRVRQFLDKIF